MGLIFSSNGNSKSVKLNKQLCICLLLGHIFLLLLLDRQIVNQSQIGCAISGIFLHFIFLCAFMWMALEGFFIYRQLVLVFPTGSNLSTRTYFIMGYGVPFGIVGITAAVSFGTDTYGYGAGEFCWLSPPHYIWTFAGPVLVIILSNTVLMFLAIRNISQSGNVRHSTQKNEVYIVWTTTSLSCLLGIGWIFGFFYMQVTPVFIYLFTIINASQLDRSLVKHRYIARIRQ
ncbi:unnamed protein product [Darwinula stevensoni]|uniref:G-protein coupled receptors family 2 profile 2 domain-containing protein n=1 Tax=Darwinula stevensoni TaxID=69355 RepID=A0A7R9FRZ3_9CRUS|nr:unnamed protein product [Darwinula stevensoni]CAG0902210.1 unnamed protein product [Darwinula stevensoni]